MTTLYKKIISNHTSAILILILGLAGCNKGVDVQAPLSSLNQQNVYALDGTAISVMTGVYTNMSGNYYTDFTGYNGISVLSGLSSDELTLSPAISNTDETFYYYTNALFSNAGGTSGDTKWADLYNYIYTTNAAIEGLSGTTTLTPSVKQQLMGEAKFMRGFFYFYLVNMFGDVPLVLSSNYKTNSLLPRSSSADVYNQIVADLKDAQGLLSANYEDITLLNTTTERVRPNKWAADALLARVYLYKGDYANAEIQADSVIGNSSLFNLDTLNGVFLANSKEAIWQLQPVTTGHNTEDAITFIIPPTGPGGINPVYLSSSLLNSFEPADNRRLNWVDSIIIAPDTFYYPYKYKSATYGDPVTEYLMVLRLGEQYLIRAEARAQQGNTSGAASDLNAIRSRAGLGPTSAGTAAELLAAVQHERKLELFTEWGNRWFDLKRTGNADAVMGTGGACAAKGGTWSPNWQLYPILYTDILADPNLKQNPGY